MWGTGGGTGGRHRGSRFVFISTLATTTNTNTYTNTTTNTNTNTNTTIKANTSTNTTNIYRADGLPTACGSAAWGKPST